MLRHIRVVYLKELRDALRDKRALYALGYFVLGVPAFSAFIFFLISLGDDDAAIRAQVYGADLAPGIVAFMERAGITPEAMPLDQAPDNLMTLPDGIDAVVIVPADFAERLDKGQMARVRVFADRGGRKTIERSGDVMTALNAYAAHMASARLVTRGVPPVLTRPFWVDVADVAEESFLRRFLSDIMLLFFIFAPFATGASVATDIFVGERERQSLQPLMAQPVSPLALALGKWGLVLTFGLTGAVLSFLVVSVGLYFAPGDFLVVEPTRRLDLLFLALLQLVPLAMLAASVQTLVSISVKGFKEAQTYNGIVMMLPMIMAYVKVYASDSLPAAAAFLPILADMESLGRLLFADRWVAGSYFTAVAVGLLGTALALALTVRRLGSEKLLDAA
ncbi:ABC transporter permease [Eilatimonas milleporae]|uniref:Sodium transport system permease protein n=1 Tax=Eilatimonas milleporae TaxID=911205 RepID=A0A3M0CNM8_9PROT|nr:ABC transporter permease subunit [Eilatimonas milleporae]RMB08386.1 sodium transport system permease protein [Eilatimonas milleporae]